MTARGPARWWHECVTEAIRVTTVRRNVVIAAVATVVALASPWAFLAAFGWLRGEGVPATSLEVVSLAQRNQTLALALMVALGLQAYLSDASDGMLAGALAVGGRRAVAGGKLLFGVLASVLLGVACAASAALASVVLGLPDPGFGAAATGQFWVVSTVSLVAALLLHYEFGLVVAMTTRSKGLAIAVGLMVPFVLLGLVRAGLQAVAPSSATLAGWVLPTELASTLLSWVPGGNTLVEAPADGLWPRSALLAGWLFAGAAAWLLVLRRRPLYPADQG